MTNDLVSIPLEGLAVKADSGPAGNARGMHLTGSLGTAQEGYAGPRKHPECAHDGISVSRVVQRRFVFPFPNKPQPVLVELQTVPLNAEITDSMSDCPCSEST
jgi:hypothetical protein